MPSNVSGYVTEYRFLLSQNRIFVLRTFTFFGSQKLSYFEEPEALPLDILMLFWNQQFRGILPIIQIHWLATRFLCSVNPDKINYFCSPQWFCPKNTLSRGVFSSENHIFCKKNPSKLCPTFDFTQKYLIMCIIFLQKLDVFKETTLICPASVGAHANGFVDF